MATFEDVARLALALPGVEETTSYGRVSWAVVAGLTGKAAAKRRGFVWERPLSQKDRRQLTEAGEVEVPPDDVILAARVEDLVEKEAVLVRLDRIDDAALEEIVTSAWLALAPPKLVEQRAADPGTGGASG